MLTTIRRRLRRVRLPAVAPATVITLLGSLGVTAVLYVGMRNVEKERDRAEFQHAAESRFASVERSFDGAKDALLDMNLLFTAVGDVDRDQFEAFAGPLSAHHPEVQALVFHRFVSAAGRSAFEATRGRDWPGFQITERGPDGMVRAAERPLYLVDDYIVPLRGNEVTYGYDAWSQPVQRELAQRAIDTGQVAASGPVPLLQHQGNLGKPVYRMDMPLTDAAARRRAAIGDTEVVIDLVPLIERNLAHAGLLDSRAIGLTLFTRTDAGPEHVFHYGAATGQAPAWRSWFGRDRSAARPLEVGGHPWQMAVGRPAGDAPVHLGSSGILLLGTLLSVALASYVQSRAQRTRRIERLVAQRTAALHRAMDALHLYQRAIEANQNGIILVSATRPGYPVEYVNPAYERMLQRSARDLIGRRLADLLRGDPDQPGIEELRMALREGRATHTLLRYRDADGQERYSEVYIAPVRNKAGQVEHFVVTLCDVTTAKHYESELEHRARYDALTGLPNRALLVDRLQQALCFAAVGSGPVWVAAIDLDQFKFVNDSLGHQAGNKLLQLVAPRIVGALERTDTVARTGGDEFVAVLPGRRDERQAAAAVQRVLDAVAEPLPLENQVLVVTCSAGVAGYPVDGQDAEALIKHAEIAMYRAKEAGRNTVQFYTPAMTERVRGRLELEGALRGALTRGEFELHYQPQVDLANGCVVGLEALIRWRHPQWGTVPPARFIGLAEETGLIVPIGAWALRTACYQSRSWQSAGLAPLRVAVNLSARQFAEPDLQQAISGVLAETGLQPACLEIEVTESLMMTNAEAAIGTMHELTAMGIGLSIDDFGTGYSSLSYLKRLPANMLKIDRSFVHDLAASPDAAAMVSAIITLARGLRMRVIAEGVETPAQIDYLRAQGCDYVQGFFYSKALPVPEVEHILRQGRCFAPAPA
jgi:diguanylate cyclase (GGDEF)-like protein/PAS domain S-box-containing protein